MAGDLVLITGATGHLGFRVLVLALQAGYTTRVAVRSQSKAKEVLAAPSIQALNPQGRLQFVVVPDILANGAYDYAVKDVKYIIHCASPITNNITSDFEKNLIEPAVKGTTGILDSALKSPSISRIVITSSVVAIVPISIWSQDSTEIYDGKRISPPQTTPYESERQAYVDSKVRALVATHDFLAQKKPAFDIINLMPPFIIGRNELVRELADFTHGTNKVLMGQVLGNKNPNPLPGTTIWLDDIARLHVLALDGKIPGNSDYPAGSGGTEGVTLSDAIEIVKTKYPEEVKKGLLPNNGVQGTTRVRVDVSETEKTFGIKFAGLETQVTEVVDHYLELKGKASEAA